MWFCNPGEGWESREPLWESQKRAMRAGKNYTILLKFSCAFALFCNNPHVIFSRDRKPPNVIFWPHVISICFVSWTQRAIPKSNFKQLSRESRTILAVARVWLGMAKIVRSKSDPSSWYVGSCNLCTHAKLPKWKNYLIFSVSAFRSHVSGASEFRLHISWIQSSVWDLSFQRLIWELTF